MSPNIARSSALGLNRALAKVRRFLTSLPFDVTSDTRPLLFTDGADKGKTALGIYKLDDDVLTICRGAPSQARPTEFASKPASGYALMSYQRAK